MGPPNQPLHPDALPFAACGTLSQMTLSDTPRFAAGPYINLIKVDPYLDPLLGDPRFEALVSKILSGSAEQAPQSSEQP
jgi:hypothetical protein